MKETKIHGDRIRGDSLAIAGTVPLGIFFALVAALISGISIFYNKQVVISGIDPIVFNVIKNGGVAVILSLLLLKRSPLAFGKETPWLKLILIGVIGGSLPFLLFFEGLSHIPAINANIIQKSLFIWVALLAIPFLKEKLNLLQIIGYLLVIYANFFIGGIKEFSFSAYEGMILLATLLWSVENIIAKKVLKNLDSTTVAWGRMFFGTLVLLTVAFISGKIGTIWNLTFQQILPILGSIGLLTLYVLTFYKALKLAPATTVTAILVLATPITNFLSAIFITHNLPLALTSNSTEILFGVMLIILGLRWRIKIAA